MNTVKFGAIWLVPIATAAGLIGGCGGAGGSTSGSAYEELPQTIESIVSNPVDGKVYAATQSEILQIDPRTGGIVNSIDFSAEQLVVSGDGRTLYALPPTWETIQMYSLPGLTPSGAVQAGNSPAGGYAFLSIAALTDQPQSIVALVQAASPTIAVFDGAVARPQTQAVSNPGLSGVGYSPTTHEAYVPTGDNSVQAYPITPSGLGASSAVSGVRGNSWIWVADATLIDVYGDIVDLRTGQLTQVQSPPNTNLYPIGLSAAGNTLYMAPTLYMYQPPTSQPSSSEVYAVSTASGQVTGSFAVPVSSVWSYGTPATFGQVGLCLPTFTNDSGQAELVIFPNLEAVMSSVTASPARARTAPSR